MCACRCVWCLGGGGAVVGVHNFSNIMEKLTSGFSCSCQEGFTLIKLCVVEVCAFRVCKYKAKNVYFIVLVNAVILYQTRSTPRAQTAVTPILSNVKQSIYV